jgi:Galactose binding lectin domain
MTPRTTAVLCFLVQLSLLVIPGVRSDAVVSVVWSNETFTSKTQTTLQLVINPLILRDSPIHDAVYATLQRLNTTHARYASWFPYPKLSVPALDPPSGLSQCGDVGVGYELQLSCARGGGVIDSVEFASFGLPSGVCTALVNTSCDAGGSADVVRKICLGQQNCSVPATVAAFGDPCPDHRADYRLAVQISCNPPQNNTYWSTTHSAPSS